MKRATSTRSNLRITPRIARMVCYTWSLHGVRHHSHGSWSCINQHDTNRPKTRGPSCQTSTTSLPARPTQTARAVPLLLSKHRTPPPAIRTIAYNVHDLPVPVILSVSPSSSSSSSSQLWRMGFQEISWRSAERGLLHSLE